MTKYVRGRAPHLRKKVHAWIPYVREGITTRFQGKMKACKTRGLSFGMTHDPAKLTCKRCDKPEIRRQMRDAT